jgi:hypothetical protein
VTVAGAAERETVGCEAVTVTVVLIEALPPTPTQVRI